MRRLNRPCRFRNKPRQAPTPNLGIRAHPRLTSGKTSKGHFGTQSLGCAGQTVRPSVHSISQTSAGKLSILKLVGLCFPSLMSDGDDSRLIGATARENRPGDAGELVGEGDRQHIAVEPPRCLPHRDGARATASVFLDRTGAADPTMTTRVPAYQNHTNRSLAMSNRVSGIGTWILKIADQRLPHKIGRLPPTI